MGPLEKHKVFRRASLLWVLLLLTWVILQVFDDVSKITAPVASSLAAAVGLLTPIIGFYVHARTKEDGNHVGTSRG